MRTLILIMTFALVSPALADEIAPRVEHENAFLEKDAPFVIRAEITDEDGIFDPTLVYRIPPEDEFQRAPLLEKDGAYEVELALPEGTLVVEYFIEAYDNLGNGPGLAGSAESPLRAESAKEKATETKADASTGSGESTETDAATGGEKTDPTLGQGIDNKDTQVREDEGSSAGLWLGVSAGVVAVAGAAVGGYFAYRYFTRDDVPPSVKVSISGPSPVEATP